MATERLRRGWLLGLILCVLGSISLVGCGGGNRTSVAGTVTLNGQPADGIRIIFSPDAAKGNTASISCESLVKEGRYELRTNAVNRADSGSGVPLGWYKVTVFDPASENRKKPVAKAVIPEKYLHVQKTPLEIEVKDKPEPGAYDIKLTK